jgi:hypothetical protein
MGTVPTRERPERHAGPSVRSDSAVAAPSCCDREESTDLMSLCQLARGPLVGASSGVDRPRVVDVLHPSSDASAGRAIPLPARATALGACWLACTRRSAAVERRPLQRRSSCVPAPGARDSFSAPCSRRTMAAADASCIVKGAIRLGRARMIRLPIEGQSALGSDRALRSQVVSERRVRTGSKAASRPGPCVPSASMILSNL